jgi:hypothetical protein
MKQCKNPDTSLEAKHHPATQPTLPFEASSKDHPDHQSKELNEAERPKQ